MKKCKWHLCQEQTEKTYCSVKCKNKQSVQTRRKNIKKHIKYNEVEYTRNHPQLCSMDGTFYINKEENALFKKLLNNNNFNKRMKKLK